MALKGRRFLLLENVFIVPAAHFRVTHVSFQTEMYELFHRTWGGRLGHMIGTPTVLFGALVIAGGLPGKVAPAVALGLGLVITAWGLAVDRLAGVLTAIAVGALATGAFVLARSLGDNTVHVGLGCMAGGCAVQTLSHLFEDVPPPLSGSEGFVTPRAWRRGVGARGLARATVLTTMVFYWLELWAAFRILPLQILHVLMLAGYRPDLRRALDERITAIVGEQAGDWQEPAPPSRQVA